MERCNKNCQYLEFDIGPGGNELRTTFIKEWIFSYLDGGYAQGAGTTIYGGNTGAAG